MLAKIRNANRTMQRQLLLYMLALALLLIFALFSGIIMLGRFDSAEKNINETLEFQMEVFRKDMSMYFESLAASTIDLSGYVSEYIDSDSEIAGSAFHTLTNNPEKIEQLQSDLIGPLTQKLENQNCSGIIVMLDATVNNKVADAALSRTGLYLQHNRYQNDDSVYLFRGNSAVGKSQNVMPHRKWRLEFRTDMFPNYDEVVAAAKLPLNESYMITKSTTLSGTSDEVVLMVAPIVGSDGTFYGVCGYEISMEYFQTYHIQPTIISHLVCMFAADTEDGFSPAQSLVCTGTTDYTHLPDGNFKTRSAGGQLQEIYNSEQSYIGITSPLIVSPNNEAFHLVVMEPKSDYDREVVVNTLQTILLIGLLLFFAISCCLVFSRRFLAPILKGMEQIKEYRYTEEPSPVPEINDLFAFLAEQDKLMEETVTTLQHEKDSVLHDYERAQQILVEKQADYEKAKQELAVAQTELQRVAYARKTEVDPENYAMFKEGLETLSPMERVIFQYYLEGKTVKEITELANIKESTVRFHNRNIYSKLGVTGLKEMLRYATMLSQEQN